MPNKKKKFSPEIIEAVRQYNLIDDILFTKAAEEKDFCQEILRTVCEDPELVVVSCTTQRRLQNLRGRSVVFDALCKLKNNALVNIEVQKANIDDYQRRMRYNGSILAANVVRKSTKFKEVPNVIIVLISSFDLFKKGCALYHVDRVLRETGEIVDNGLSEIYVNAAVKDESKVSKLMRIFVDLKAYNDKLFPVVSSVKKHYKETEEGECAMCAITEKLVGKILSKKSEEVFKKGEARGIEKGETKGFLKSIKNLMSNLHFSAEESMNALNIPEKERVVYLEMLKQQ